MRVQHALDQLRQNLQRLAQANPVNTYNDHVSSVGPIDVSGTFDLTVAALIHGNEPGGLFALNQFLQNLIESRQKLVKSICIIIGNFRAAELGVRYVERDLNRCFGGTGNLYYEEGIARQIEPYILKSKRYIDLHQTVGPTNSDFFIFPCSKANVAWAHFLSPSTPIIVHGHEFSKDGTCSDSFLVENGGLGITYEMGQIADDTLPVARTTAMLHKAYLHNAFEQTQFPNFLYTWCEVFNTSANRDLVDGLQNFSSVQSGQVLGHDGTSEFYASYSGYVLFPKYGDAAKTSSELCRIIKAHPTSDILQLDFTTLQLSCR